MSLPRIQDGKFAAAASLFALLCLFVSVQAPAQSVWAKGGVSTLMGSSGFETDYKWAPVQGWFGAGFGNGFEVGGYTQMKTGGYTFGAGDRYLPINLGTDIFDGSRYFAGRGLFASHGDDRQSWSTFAGATAEERSYSFFRSFDTEQPTAAFLLERKLTALGGAEYQAVNIIQDKMTSLHSISFKLRPNWKFDTGAGIGGNSGFASVGSEYETRQLDIQAGYTSVGDSFNRIGGVRTNAPERAGANIRFRYQPSRRLGFTAGHENFFSPVVEQQNISIHVPIRVSLDSASAYGSIRGFQLGASASTSSAREMRSTTQTFNVSRPITRGIQASGSVMLLGTNAGPTTRVYSASVNERYSARLSLNQGVVTQQGMTSMSFGGNFTSNRLILGIQHDLLYTPLAGGFGNSNYTHVWSINLNLSVFHGVRLHTNSYVDPVGRVRYTAWGDGIGWSHQGEETPSSNSASPSFGKFVVKGAVQDEKGEPIWGIRVQVDGHAAYSDNKGQFFLRFGKGLQYPVAVNAEASLNPQAYEVVRAPVSALAESEDMATPIVIVLRSAGRTSPKGPVPAVPVH
jgi:hypothetical protein